MLEFLWKGSPHPMLVQRIGAWLIGLWLMGIGMLFISFAIQEYVRAIGPVKKTEALPVIFFLIILSVPYLVGGVRVFRNGFPRRSRVAPNEPS
jgi:uncharacterized membrane protein YidH (DUF202 family)